MKLKLNKIIEWDNEDNIITIFGSNINDKEDLKNGLNDINFYYRSNKK